MNSAENSSKVWFSRQLRKSKGNLSHSFRSINGDISSPRKVNAIRYAKERNSDAQKRKSEIEREGERERERERERKRKKEREQGRARMEQEAQMCSHGVLVGTRTRYWFSSCSTDLVRDRSVWSWRKGCEKRTVPGFWSNIKYKRLLCSLPRKVNKYVYILYIVTRQQMT